MKFNKISLKNYVEIPEEQRNGIYEIENLGTYYVVNGKLHREDGPAFENIFGYKEWHINGKRHRLDGPAIKSKIYEHYWIENKSYSSKEEFELAAYLYINGLQDYL